MLKEKLLFGTVDKVDIAIRRLQAFEPPEGYYLAFSGGKDSIVIKQMAIEAGVKFDAHYSVTTIDPPDLIYYIREHHPDVIWERPEMPFLRKMISKGFPLRQSRWCCELYKENGGSGRLVVTGIRKAESNKRSKRKMVEHCIKDKSKRLLHPIIDWLDEDVWAFIKDRNLPYCKLYDEGWARIGCLFCPMQQAWHKKIEGKRYPSFERAFRRAFQKLYDTGRESMARWKDGDEMFDWWISGKGNKEDDGLWLFEG